MHIILVSNRLATAKTLNVVPRLSFLLVTNFIVLAFAISFLFPWIEVCFNVPFAIDLVATTVQQLQNRKTEDYMRDNVSSMVIKLGEMQPQLMRLDLLGEGVSKQTAFPCQKTMGSDRRLGALDSSLTALVGQ